MTLVDAGPLVALVNRSDRHYGPCSVALTMLPDEPLRTTWPCVAEAMHLLGRDLGHPGREELWGMLLDGLIEILPLTDGDAVRMRELMRQYRDAPMDLADASLVAAAERLGVRRVFTVDHHFYAYRLRGTDPFEVIP